MKHTKGPWKVNDMALNYVVHSETFVQCRTDGHSDVDLANAQLMATAPELLEAAQETLAWLHEFVGADAMAEILGEAHGTRPVEAIQKLLKACAKASGGAQ